MEAIVAIALTLSVTTTTHAQGRTDVVTLANGDRITGEVKRLERGRLEFKTDDAGTLYLEWDKLSSLVAKRLVEVLTTDGHRFLGSLGRAADRSIAVVTLEGDVPLHMSDVTLITPIGTGFWRQLDGSIDTGFSYARSSGVAQLNLDSDTVYRRLGPGHASPDRSPRRRKTTSRIATIGRTLDLSYLQYPWQRWFILTAGRFETNESVGLKLRSQIGAAAGPRLVNSNRAQLVLGAGLALNREQGVNVEPTGNLQAFFAFGTSFSTVRLAETNVDVNLQYYPSLSNAGRQRVQLDAGVKREFWKDVFAALNLYTTYDNRPPNPTANNNDVGVVLSIGWSYSGADGRGDFRPVTLFASLPRGLSSLSPSEKWT